MMKMRNFLGMFLGVALMLLPARADAVSFADYVYKSVRLGNTASVKRYLAKGYNIDSKNADGMSALCLAAARKDYKTYRSLRKLGAKSNQECLPKTAEAEAVTKTNGSQNAAYKNDDKTWLYAALGVAAVGTGTALALNNGGSKKKHKCAEDEELVDGDCRPIICPEGEHLVGGVCQPIVCSEGEQLVGSECQPIICPDGMHLEGNVCVDDPECEPGYKSDGNGGCVMIVCPPNTVLQGSICIAVGDVVEDNKSDDDLYGINSIEEDVFNLYSSPKHPDDGAFIDLTNLGNGNVYGVYGLSNVFNSYVVGENNGVHNPIEAGTGRISIEDQGAGDVYGMYARVTDVTRYKEAINASGWDGGTAYGNIDISHIGGGASYGVFGDVRAYNAYAAYGGTAYGNIKIEGDGDIYGISGYAAATNAVSPFFGKKVRGDIDLFSNGNGNVYGMFVNKDNIPGAGAGDNEHLASWFAFNAYASGGGDVVEGNIKIHNKGSGNVYGMYGGQQLYNAMSYGGQDESGRPDGTAIGLIDIVNHGNGDVYGMYMPEADTQGIVANVTDNGSTSYINIVNTGDGVTTGLRGGRGNRIINSGEININNLGNGTVYGIYGEAGARIDNSGLINIYRLAYTDPIENTVYNPSSALGGKVYGIYAESGAEVFNSGRIVVSGAQDGKGIFLESGAKLENTGRVIFNGVEEVYYNGGPAGDGDLTNGASVDFDDMGGEIILGKGGSFFADEMKGKLSVSDKTVTGSFDNEYVLKSALEANKVDDLNLVSKSAMFKAAAVANDKGGYDVVMKRQNFKDLLEDKSLAAFLEQNYMFENNSEFYDWLKKQAEQNALAKKAANVSGTDMLPNFWREDALVYRNLNRQFNNDLFNKSDEKFIGGYKYIDISSDPDGTLMGSDGKVNVAYGMIKGKNSNGIVSGVGLSAAMLKSDYDNGSDRKSNMFGLWIPVGYNFGNGARWYSKFYAGYADNSYNRLTEFGKKKGDYDEYQYGLGNEVRYRIDLGDGTGFEPVAELNFLGVYQEAYNEGNSENALKVDSSNNLSLEGGIGAYLTKDIRFDEDNKLGIRIGGVYYVEFLDPDDGVDASMRGMSGKFKIARKSNKERGVLGAHLRYDYKDITLYGDIEQEFGNNDALVIDAGVQYNF